MGAISKRPVPLQDLNPPEYVFNFAPTDNFGRKLPASVAALVLAYFTFRYSPWRPSLAYGGILLVPYGYTLFAGYGALLNKLIYNDGFLLPW